jgi:hypothetical protein
MFVPADGSSIWRSFMFSCSYCICPWNVHTKVITSFIYIHCTCKDTDVNLHPLLNLICSMYTYIFKHTQGEISITNTC